MARAVWVGARGPRRAYAAGMGGKRAREEAAQAALAAHDARAPPGESDEARRERKKREKKARKEARRAERRGAAEGGGGADESNGGADATAEAAPSSGEAAPQAGSASGHGAVGASGSSTVGPCNVCGAMGHLGRTCPRRTCRVCGETGHIAKHCAKGATCAHCGRKGHLPKACTFGAAAHEKFIFCKALGQPCGCFARRFVVPLRRADATMLDPLDLRSNGRADVGTGCIASALFLSQSIRANTSVTLCFGHCQKNVEVRGSVVRGLRPDDASVAARLRLAATAPKGEDDGVNAATGEVVDAEKYSASLKRGFQVSDGSTEDALREALTPEQGMPAPVLLILDAYGTPIADACAEMVRAVKRGEAPASRGCGIVTLLGDDRGLHEDDELTAERIAEEVGAHVMRVSLGRHVLFSIHSITLLHHYLDEHMHCCAAKAVRDMGGRKG